MKHLSSIAAPVYLLFATLVLHGCNKKPKVYSINPDLKKAFVYKPGSYWIYKDSISSRIDSLYVTATNYTSISTGSSHPSPDKIEHIQIELHQINVSSIGSNEGVTWTYYYEYDMFGMNLITIINSNIKSVSYFPLVNYPFLAALTIREPNGLIAGDLAQGTDATLHLSYTCPAGTFNDVAQMHRWGTGKDLTLDDYFDLSAEAGFVRMDLTHDSVRHVWELQRYHLVK